MSKPPRPHFKISTTGTPIAVSGHLNYLPDEFADFNTLQNDLAISEGGIVASTEKGDFTRTLMELSSLIAHILGFYQQRYAREGFLSTAQSPRSLVKHGRRLGYEPDPGLAATGFVTFTGELDDQGHPISGTIPVGFGLESKAVGDKDPQNYETIEPTLIDASFNEFHIRKELTLQPVLATQPPKPWTTFTVQGSNLGLAPGDVVVVQDSKGGLSVRKVKSFFEDPAEPDTTTITVDTPLVPMAYAVATQNIAPLADNRPIYEAPPDQVLPVAVPDGNVVLLTGQINPAENGLWVVGPGQWVRPFEFAVGFHASNRMVYVTHGNLFPNTNWVCLSPPGKDVVGTDLLLYPTTATLVSTTNITSLFGEQTINNVTTNGDRVLLVGQSDYTQNGLWVTNIDKWKRPADWSPGSDPAGRAVLISGRIIGQDTTRNVPVWSPLAKTLWLVNTGAGIAQIQDLILPAPTPVFAVATTNVVLPTGPSFPEPTINNVPPAADGNPIVDGVEVPTGSLLLLANQTNPIEFGVYSQRTSTTLAWPLVTQGGNVYTTAGVHFGHTVWQLSEGVSGPIFGVTFQQKIFDFAHLDFSHFTLYAHPNSTFFLFGSSASPATFPDAALKQGSFVDCQPTNERGHALVVENNGNQVVPDPKRILGPAFVATDVNIDTLAGEITIDGFSMSQGQRVLLVGQKDKTQNGLWIVQAPFKADPVNDPNFNIHNNPNGNWKRPPDFPSGFTGEQGMIVYVQNGTFASRGFMCMLAFAGYEETPGVDFDQLNFVPYPLIDTVHVPIGSRVLLNRQTDPRQNGLWVTTGSRWYRPPDFAKGSSASGAFVIVDYGAIYANTAWVCSTAAPGDVIQEPAGAVLSAFAVSTTNIDITAAGTPTVDGQSVPFGARILLVGQTDPNQNGLWEYNGSLFRPFEFKVNTHAAGVLVTVQGGNTLAGTLWACTNDPASDVVNQNPLTFVATSGLQFREQLDASGKPFLPINPCFGYVVAQGYFDEEIYLSTESIINLVGQPVVRVVGADREGFLITSERSINVLFQRKDRVPGSTTLTDPQGRSSSAIVDSYPISPINGFVSALRLRHQPSFQGAGLIESRRIQDFRNAQILADWKIVAPFVSVEPSTQLVLSAPSVVLESLFANMLPAQYVELATLDDTYKEIARLTHVGVDTDTGFNFITWDVVDPADAAHQRPWTFGNLKFHGNVAHISHGKTIAETLGSSDGVSPFLKFQLKEKPLTYLPGANIKPQIEIRVGAVDGVGGVAWTRVNDFFDSGNHDLHYKLQRDELQDTFVLFGDGIHGAVPPFGTDHVACTYRIGLGVSGDNPPPIVSRVKLASPLIQAVTNARDISGGADPADAGAILTLATRFIRTFDRAVSVQDHADLALLFPGVSRAQAKFGILGKEGPGGITAPSIHTPSAFGIEAVQVIVADQFGNIPNDWPDIKLFLNQRRDTALPLFVTGPTIVDVYLTLKIETDPAYLADSVKVNVRNALYGSDPKTPGLLTFTARDLGQPLFLSEIYDTVRAVPGVTFVRVDELDTQLTEPGLIRLSPGDFTAIGIQDPVTSKHTHFTLYKPGMKIGAGTAAPGTVFIVIAKIIDDSRLLLVRKVAADEAVDESPFLVKRIADVIQAQPDQWLRLQPQNFNFVDV